MISNPDYFQNIEGTRYIKEVPWKRQHGNLLFARSGFFTANTNELQKCLACSVNDSFTYFTIFKYLSLHIENALTMPRGL